MIDNKENIIGPKINIVILSIENENIKTEKIYFSNKDNPGCLSLKRDKSFLGKIRVNDLFFIAFNINASEKK